MDSTRGESMPPAASGSDGTPHEGTLVLWQIRSYAGVTRPQKVLGRVTQPACKVWYMNEIEDLSAPPPYRQSAESVWRCILQGIEDGREEAHTQTEKNFSHHCHLQHLLRGVSCARAGPPHGRGSSWWGGGAFTRAESLFSLLHTGRGREMVNMKWGREGRRLG